MIVRRFSNSMWSVLSVAVGAVVWELSARIIDLAVFPPATRVVVRLVELLGEETTRGHLYSSLTNLVIGFAIALVLGLAVGVAMAVWPRFSTAVGVYVKALLIAPSLVFAPIFFGIFGLSRWTIIGVVVIHATFIIMLNTEAAVRQAPVSLVEMGRSFCATRPFIVRRIVLPSAVPLVIAGVRLGAGRAVRGMVNGEMFIAVVGLGGAIMAAGRRLDLTTVMAMLVLIILVAFGVLAIVSWAERRLTPWVESNLRA